MAVTVKIHQPVAYDPEVVARVLGEQPLPLDVADLVLAPFITINGRLHGPTSDFLRRQCLAKPNLATARRIGNDLVGWLNHLCNRCQLPPFEDRRDPLLQATEEHFASYYRLRQYGDPDDVLTPEGWAHAASSIKRLYEYAQVAYQHQPPFDIIRFSRQNGGTGTTIGQYKARRRKTGSAGTPLTPEYADQLIMGALRIDAAGSQESYRGADRDHAIISLALGSGLRRNNLLNITTYEIPPVSRLPITTMRVADSVTKNNAGGDALVFSHRLPPVHDYIAGARADAVARLTGHPSRPALIIEADSVTVTYDRDGNSTPVTTAWTNLPDEERRRLVEPDGSSPILFLNEYTGKPLSYDAYQDVIDSATAFVRSKINRDFPDRFRLHDLRHTYAVHLTIAIYKGVLADAVASNRREDWTVDHIAAAVELVKASLGHASEASTKLYTQTAHRFLTIPVGQFTGQF